MSSDPARLYAPLLNTGLQRTDNRLYQVIHDLIDNLVALNKQLNSTSSSGSSGSTGSQGIQGFPGFGLDGLDGEDSIPVPGPKGDTGISNVPGPTGPMGAIIFPPDAEDGDIYPPQTGPQGNQGVQGIQGLPGVPILIEDGLQGEDGLTIASQPQVIPAFTQTIESTLYALTNAYADVTGLTVNITPKSKSSKIRVTAVINTYFGSALTVVNYQILRGASVIKEYMTAGFNNNAAQFGTSIVLDYLDSPASITALTYKIQAKCPNAVSAFVNQLINGGDVVFSSITVEEILQ